MSERKKKRNRNNPSSAEVVTTTRRQKTRARALDKMDVAELREELATALAKFEKSVVKEAVNKFNIERLYMASNTANARLDEEDRPILSWDDHLAYLRRIADAPINKQPPKDREEAKLMQDMVREELEILTGARQKAEKKKEDKRKITAMDLVQSIYTRNPGIEHVAPVLPSIYYHYKMEKIDAKTAQEAVHQFQIQFFEDPNLTMEKNKHLLHYREFRNTLEMIVTPEKYAARMAHEGKKNPRKNL